MKRVGLTCMLTVAGCATIPQPIGPTAALGELAATGGPRVRPLAVIEDSRCPALVRCVWAGRVRLLTVIELRGGSEELRTTLTLGEPLQVADGALTLVAVTPQKKPGAQIKPHTYRFTFRFDGGL